MRRSTVAMAACLALWGAALGSTSRASDSKAPPDLSGEWRLDAAHSDSFRPPGGDGGGSRSGGSGSGNWGGGGGRGGWGGGGGGGGGRGGWGGGGGGRGGRRGGGNGSGNGGGDAEGSSGEARPRPMLLPDLVHFTQTPEIVSIEDSSGTVMDEIVTIDAKSDTLVHAPGARVFYGVWKGDRIEIANGTGRPGITQRLSLDQKGGSLVLETTMAAMGDRPARTVHRVYHKVEAR